MSTGRTGGDRRRARRSHRPRAAGIAKRFGATAALTDVGLTLRAGEVHALVGENGAGKSTLIKVMTGIHSPDEGTILVDGEPVVLRDAADAQRRGIAAIYQEPLIFPDLSVAENIFIGHQDRGRVVRWKQMQRDARAILESLDVDLDPRAQASGLPVAGQQAVEIAKAISLDVRVLIMDEPTASLSAHEVERLFRQVRRLVADGVAVLFISHRLDEVFAIADRITVFRDGQHISTHPRADVTEASLIREMVGREVSDLADAGRHDPVHDRGVRPDGRRLRQRAVLQPGHHQPGHHRGAGRGPDPGDPHPQHRPVGGLDRGRDRLRERRVRRRPPRRRPLLAIGLAVAIGGGLGLLNGLLVAYGNVPAIVVTLGTLAIYRSWLIGHADSKSITADSLPDWVIEFPRRTVFDMGELDLRVVFALTLAVVVVGQVVLSRLRWGRRLYAIGSNPDAAVRAGLPQRRLVLGAFAACGALSGLAGFLFLARFGTITVVAGQGLELDAIGAAVVGGVSILGGAGTIVGALLGAVLIDLLDQSLARTDQVSEFWRNAILGVLILAAVIGDVAIGRRFRRRWARAARGREATDA